DANSADVIDTLFIPAGGSGYVNGETVTLLGSVGSTNGTGTATVVAGGGVFAVTAVTVTDGGTGHAVGNTITIQGSGSGAVGSVTTVSAIAVNPDRTLITNQPRTGEGIPTPSILNSDAWDGRNDTGRLLPAGNYLAYITAQSFDEFDYNTTGTADVARSKTHQISLDPLQITDVAITGLAQQSTSYAKIDLLLTESAKVYWEIYEPGTEVTTLYTGTLGGGTLTAPGIGPVVPSGSLVARYVEQKPLRTPEDLKWDGTCNATATVSACNTGATYGLGVPLADGNYPYALWAEIPYETGANTENVKTVQYYTGYIPVERGLVETTVNSIGYTTVGSSPTAYNIDPFVFQYSINRDALVDMKILTNDGAEAVRTLFTTQTVQGSFQNQEVWNGIDDTGRYVGPGTYMLQIVTQDALFPTEPTKRTTTTVFFPVDLFRVVDVEATNLLGGEGETADISYTLSKSMQAYLRIYALGTEIPTNGQWPPSIATIGTPIKTFAGALLPGENLRITELWDGLDDNGNVLPDGEYPFFIEAKTPATTEVAVYYDANGDSQTVTNTASYPATDRVTGFVKIVRGQIEFKTDSLKSVATKPTLIYTSENVSTPPYEIQFEVLQEAEVSVEILATAASSSAVCPAEGDTCRTLTKTAGEVFDADLVHSLFWDAKDSNGAYVPTGAYRVKFSALDHPDNLQDANIRYLNQVVDYEVYDIERTFISPQSPTALIGYQVGVPMKVGIQIFKPGTGIQADGTLLYQGAAISSVNEVLVKSIVGLRTERIGLEDFWDGSDFALQTVPDGNYIFRFVTSTDYRAIDSVTGGLATGYTVSSLADLEAYGTSYNIEVGSGDSGFVCDDWENYTIFYPNPLRQATGTMEVTKIPIPGNVSIKVYNLAADLVRSRNYECIDLDGNTQTMTESLSVQPNFTFSSPSGSTTTLRNAELRCTWDKKNNHGKNVARGIYFVMTEFKATSGGGQHCFAVEKVLIP
ncbi:MAG: hypothetical protein HN833_03235, partial [Elusimicrobiaceae bacterium]|nr:hypothetical protein [Elusimicrobiaceae bacterium]